MWYFLIKQNVLATTQYRALQTHAVLTEVELFNEPYENWYVFSIEKDNYQPFMNYLDQEGIAYELMSDRPTRSELLANMC